MRHKVSKQKALKFFEENYIMIHCLQASNERGCAAKCLELLKKSCKEDTTQKYNEYIELEKKLINHTGMGFKDWIKHTTSIFDECGNVN